MFQELALIFSTAPQKRPFHWCPRKATRCKESLAEPVSPALSAHMALKCTGMLLASGRAELAAARTHLGQGRWVLGRTPHPGTSCARRVRASPKPDSNGLSLGAARLLPQAWCLGRIGANPPEPAAPQCQSTSFTQTLSGAAQCHAQCWHWNSLRSPPLGSPAWTWQLLAVGSVRFPQLAAELSVRARLQSREL